MCLSSLDENLLSEVFLVFLVTLLLGTISVSQFFFPSHYHPKFMDSFYELVNIPTKMHNVSPRENIYELPNKKILS